MGSSWKIKRMFFRAKIRGFGSDVGKIDKTSKEIKEKYHVGFYWKSRIIHLFDISNWKIEKQ